MFPLYRIGFCAVSKSDPVQWKHLSNRSDTYRIDLFPLYRLGFAPKQKPSVKLNNNGIKNFSKDITKEIRLK